MIITSCVGMEQKERVDLPRKGEGRVVIILRLKINKNLPIKYLKLVFYCF